MAVRFAEDFAGIALGAVIDTTNTDFTTLAGTGRFVAVQGLFGVAALLETDGTLATLRSNLGTVAPTTRWYRFYGAIEQADPTGAAHYLFVVRAGGTGLGGMRLDSDRRLHLRNGTTNLTGTGQITPAPLEVGKLARLEYHPDEVAGTQEARVFIGADTHGTVPTYVLNGPLGATLHENFVIGSTGTNTARFRFEQVVADDAGYPVPLADPTPAPAPGAAHLRETWGVPA